MRAKIIIGVLALTLAGLGLGAYWRFRGPSPLVLSGTIEARDVAVGSLLGGRVQTVQVEEGDRVTKGQVLVTFETDLVEAQVRQQEAQVAGARANLSRVLNGPRREEEARARVTWENAEKDRHRLKSLLDEGLLPRQQYDDAAARAESAHQAYLELERGSRPEDVAAARATMQGAEQLLRYLARQREEMVVRAPADGVVESMDLRPGDLVGPNRPVATLLEPGQLWVRVFVPETKLGLARVGQGAELTVDSYPDRRFPGKVVEIADRAEYTPRNIQTLEQRNDLVFGVKVQVEPTAELKAGMAATVRLLP
jgi:membrane fusion protein YbhG